MKTALEIATGIQEKVAAETTKAMQDADAEVRKMEAQAAELMAEASKLMEVGKRQREEGSKVIEAGKRQQEEVSKAIEAGKRQREEASKLMTAGKRHREEAQEALSKRQKTKMEQSFNVLQEDADMCLSTPTELKEPSTRAATVTSSGSGRDPIILVYDGEEEDSKPAAVDRPVVPAAATPDELNEGCSVTLAAQSLLPATSTRVATASGEANIGGFGIPANNNGGLVDDPPPPVDEEALGPPPSNDGRSDAVGDPILRPELAVTSTWMLLWLHVHRTAVK